MTYCKNVLRQFFLESPDERADEIDDTGSFHYGKCNIVSLFDLGTHECGLQLAGEEFVPWLSAGGEGFGKKRDR